MRNRIAIVDIATRKFKALSYKQYDANNLLQMVILENGKIIDISSYNVIIYFKMPSGKMYREFGDIKNNTIDIILSSDVLYESGKVTLEVELRETDKIVTTFSIYLNVEKSIDGNDTTDIEETKVEDIRHFHYNKDALDIITQEMIDEWNNKKNLSDLVNDVGFVNEKYVIDKIAEAQLDGTNIELTDYVKKTQMNEEIKKLTDADTSITEQMNENIDKLTSENRQIITQMTQKDNELNVRMDEKFNELKSEDENIIAQIDIKNNDLNIQLNKKIEQLKLDDKDILTESKKYTDSVISKIQLGVNFTIVQGLPVENISTSTVYLIESSEKNFYYQYMYIDDEWANLGTTEINMDDYYTKDYINTINAETKEQINLKANNLFKANMNTVSSLGGIPAGTNLNDLTIQEVLTKLLFPYITPNVSASLIYYPNASIYECGEVVLVKKINTNVIKKSENIQIINFYRNNNLINTISSDCSNGGAFSYTFEPSISITSNTSNSYFKVIVNDGVTNVTANTNSFTFVYPYYYGVINNDAEINENLIKNLTKQVVAKGNKTYSYSPNFQKMVIAYPKSYGVLKSILDPNGFEQIASFTLTELNISGLDRTSQPYYVYSNQASTNTNFNMTFKY